MSIGIAQTPEDGTEFNKLYNAADKALYHVKQNGKKSYHFFSDQNEAEQKRSSKNVDLDYLSEILSRTDSGKGTYLLDFDSFHHVYNFIKRFVDRSGRDVQTVLFTISPADGVSDPAPDETEAALEMLDKAIYTSLRRVDVSTRYSSKQIIVILMDANSENGDLVAKRIISCFEKLYIGGQLRVEYGIAKMERNSILCRNFSEMSNLSNK